MKLLYQPCQSRLFLNIFLFLGRNALLHALWLVKDLKRMSSEEKLWTRLFSKNSTIIKFGYKFVVDQLVKSHRLGVAIACFKKSKPLDKAYGYRNICIAACEIKDFTTGSIVGCVHLIQ